MAPTDEAPTLNIRQKWSTAIRIFWYMVTALHNRENCGTDFSRKLQLVLVVNLASGVFVLFIVSFSSVRGLDCATSGGRWYMVTALHNRENCSTGFSRKLQLVLVVNLASGVFGLFIFHRFEDWTAQHQALHTDAKRFLDALRRVKKCLRRPM